MDQAEESRCAICGWWGPDDALGPDPYGLVNDICSLCGAARSAARSGLGDGSRDGDEEATC